MLGASARGCRWELFPLCRSTDFMLTLKSIKKRHSCGSFWYPRASITERISLQNPRSFLERKSLWIEFTVCEINIFQDLCAEDSNLEPKSSACFFRQIQIGAGSLRSPRANKWGSDEEQLASNVGWQWTLLPSCCPWTSSESELSCLKVRFSGGFGTGNSSLCGAGLVADCKSGYVTVCLDFLLCLLNKSSYRMSGRSVPSKLWEWRTAFGANHLPILWEASHTLYNKYERPSF